MLGEILQTTPKRRSVQMKGIQILAAAFTAVCFAGAAQADTQVSSDQGSMTWDQAMSHCRGIGMRLPTINELMWAMNHFEGSRFAAQRGYWSSDTGGSVNSARWASTGTSPRWNGYSSNSRNARYHVVCIRTD
jgi:hypothetical protein